MQLEILTASSNKSQNKKKFGNISLTHVKLTTYDSFVCLRLQKEYDLHKWSVAANVLN
jgi:hypothetical protein